MKTQLDGVTLSVKLERYVKSELATDTEESLKESQDFGTLFDDLDSFFYSVANGKVSVENIMHKCKVYRERICEWQIISEGCNPEHIYVDEPEKDEDDFLD